ncbi:MAG: DUF4621 domain-containing protein [Bacteroidales bacterium]
MKQISKILILNLFLGILVSQSCVDDRYDLSKLPSSILIAGDSLILPLGSADTAYLRSFIDDKNINSIEKRDSVYFLVHRDSIMLSLPSGEELRIDNSSITTSQSAKINDIPSIINIPFVVPIDKNLGNNSSSKVLPLITSSSIKRLDYVELNNTGVKGLVTLNVGLRQTIASGPCDITFNMHIPTGMVLVPEPGNGTVNSNNDFIIHITNLSDFPISKTFKLKSLTQVVGAPITFGYTSSIIFKQGAQITYTGSDPGIDIAMSTSNLYADFLKGEINYSGSKPGIQADIKGIYSLFKNSNDIVSLYNPMLFIDSETDFGVPLKVNIISKATKNGVGILKQDNTEIDIQSPSVINENKINSFVLSNFLPSDKKPATTWKSLDLSGYLKLKPDFLGADLTFTTMPGTGTVGNPHFMSSTSKAKVKYRFELPLAFSSDFLLNYNDTILDVFKEEKVKDYLFSTGSVQIAGTFTSTIPLNATLTGAVYSTNYSEKPIVIKTQVKILADPTRKKIDTPFVFTLTAEEMKAMTNPRHLGIFVDLRAGTDINGKKLEGIPLKSTDFVFVKNLRVVKNGGIQLNLK